MVLLTQKIFNKIARLQHCRQRNMSGMVKKIARDCEITQSPEKQKEKLQIIAAISSYSLILYQQLPNSGPCTIIFDTDVPF